VRVKPPPRRIPATSIVASTTLQAPDDVTDVNTALQLGSVRKTRASSLSCGSNCRPDTTHITPSVISPTATMTYEQPILATERVHDL
jgi:hypothetical protein